MKKTPAYLKGLAEDRARAAGEVARYQKIAQDVAQTLEKAQRELDALDTVLRRFDPELNPQNIQPIRHNKSYGGGRGYLMATVISILKEAKPNPRSTAEIALEVQLRHQLIFEHPKLRQAWHHNSVAKCLRNLAAAGKVERLYGPSNYTNEAGLWRWPSGGVKESVELEALAKIDGQEVDFYDATHEEPTIADAEDP
jgi:hypothetical protein